MIPFIPESTPRVALAIARRAAPPGTSNRDRPISDMTAMVAPGLTVRPRQPDPPGRTIQRRPRSDPQQGQLRRSYRRAGTGGPVRNRDPEPQPCGGLGLRILEGVGETIRTRTVSAIPEMVSITRCSVVARAETAQHHLQPRYPSGPLSRRPNRHDSGQATASSTGYRPAACNGVASADTSCADQRYSARIQPSRLIGDLISSKLRLPCTEGQMGDHGVRAGTRTLKSFEHRHLKPACCQFHHARGRSDRPPRPRTAGGRRDQLTHVWHANLSNEALESSARNDQTHPLARPTTSFG